MKHVISIAWFVVGFYLMLVGWNAATVLKLSVPEKNSSDDKSGYNYEYKALVGDPITLNFATKGDVEEFKRVEMWTNGDWRGLILRWLPRDYAPILVPLFFGLFGGALRAFVILRNEPDATETRLALQPMGGLSIGLLFYAMSNLLPKLLVSQETTPSWHMLIWLSLVGGFFSEQAYNFLKNLTEKILGKAPSAGSAASKANRKPNQAEEQVDQAPALESPAAKPKKKT